MRVLDLSRTVIEEIPDRLCQGCSELIDVRFPPGLVQVNSHAFSRCSRLPLVDMRHTQLVRLGACAFEHCHGMHTLSCPDIPKELTAGCLGPSGLAQLHLNEVQPLIASKTVLEDRANVHDATGLRVLRALSESCFEGSGIGVLDLRRTQIEHIGCRVFRNCRSLRVLAVSNALKTLGNEVLADRGLRELDLWGAKMVKMERRTLWYAKELREIVLPWRLEDLEESFRYRSLTPVTVAPDRLKPGRRLLRDAWVVGRRCLHGAAWWCDCGAWGGATVFSGCCGSAGGQSRPLVPML